MIKSANNTKSNDLFQRAMESFETTLRAGIQLQEDSVQRCVDILRKAPLEWERTVPAKVTKAIAATQQNVDQSIRLINENAQQTVKFMEMALEIHQTTFDASEEDGCFWPHAFDAMRSNVQIIGQANAHVLEAWGTLAKDVLQRVESMREEVNRVYADRPALEKSRS